MVNNFCGKYVNCEWQRSPGDWWIINNNSPFFVSSMSLFTWSHAGQMVSMQGRLFYISSTFLLCGWRYLHMGRLNGEVPLCLSQCKTLFQKDWGSASFFNLPYSFMRNEMRTDQIMNLFLYKFWTSNFRHHWDLMKNKRNKLSGNTDKIWAIISMTFLSKYSITYFIKLLTLSGYNLSLFVYVFMFVKNRGGRHSIHYQWEIQMIISLHKYQ